MHDRAFRTKILHHWSGHGRHDLPWRKTTDPYAILVSEIMLQQTQVDRVIPKFGAFLAAFPTFRALAKSPAAKLLKVWQGLGYNRRALMLRRCARAVVHDHKGILPADREALNALPGIGPYTAGAILAFAFNKPWPVIETNIRRVYLHHFFADRIGVSDAQLLPIIERTLDRKNPRRWYSALMDYGTTLAKAVPNPNRRSKHHTKQAAFEGSDRKVRGEIVRLLLEKKRLVAAAIARMAKQPAVRIKEIVLKMERDGLVARCTHRWCVHNPHWSLPS